MTGPAFAADNWGAAARFGIFIVGNEAVPEAEWWAMAPPGVSIHAARISAPAPWAVWNDARTAVAPASDLARGAAQFAGMALSAVVLAHSTSSIVGGAGWDAATLRCLTGLLHPRTKVTTNGADCADALRACGVARPFLVFPPWFRDEAVTAGHTYIRRQGFEPPTPMRHAPEARWADLRPEELYANLMHIEQRSDLLFEQIVEACPDGADGVLIVGTGLRCVGLIEALEQALERPVVTANQASLWRCLRLAGLEAAVPGYGRLLAGGPAP